MKQNMILGTLVAVTATLTLSAPTHAMGCVITPTGQLQCPEPPSRGGGSTSSTTELDEQKLLNSLQSLDEDSLKNILNSIKQ